MLYTVHVSNMDLKTHLFNHLWLVLLQFQLLSTTFNVTMFWRSLWCDIKRVWLYINEIWTNQWISNNKQHLHSMHNTNKTTGRHNFSVFSTTQEVLLAFGVDADFVGESLAASPSESAELMPVLSSSRTSMNLILERRPSTRSPRSFGDVSPATVLWLGRIPRALFSLRAWRGCNRRPLLGDTCGRCWQSSSSSSSEETVARGDSLTAAISVDCHIPPSRMRELHSWQFLVSQPPSSPSSTSFTWSHCRDGLRLCTCWLSFTVLRFRCRSPGECRERRPETDPHWVT